MDIYCFVLDRFFVRAFTLLINFAQVDDPGANFKLIDVITVPVDQVLIKAFFLLIVKLLARLHEALRVMR